MVVFEENLKRKNPKLIGPPIKYLHLVKHLINNNFIYLFVDKYCIVYDALEIFDWLVIIRVEMYEKSHIQAHSIKYNSLKQDKT